MTVGHSTVDRLSTADLLVLCTDVGPVPMHIGAVLALGEGARATEVEEALRTRCAAVRHLRQVVETPPPGLGRPYWRDDPAFDVGDHVTRVAGSASGSLDSLLEVAAEEITRPLASTRPLWRAAVVVRPGGEDVEAVVIVLHHVLADGLGGLALLARIVDDAAPSGAARTRASPTTPRPAPATSALLEDRIVGLLDSLVALPAKARPALTRARYGWVELGHSPPRSAPRTSLNRQTGSRRVLRVVTVGLAPMKAAARRHGVTVNDVLLVATTGALARLLRARGEPVTELVVSVPVSGRARANSNLGSFDNHGNPGNRELGDRELGNRSGVMPVRVPVAGSASQRLQVVATRTRDRKTAFRGDSAALIGPAFRVLVALGTFGRFIGRQRFVNTFLSNVPGPTTEQLLCGTPIRHVVPVATSPGNVGVSFAVLSYAGELTLTVIADPDVVTDLTDLDAIAQALEAELHELAGDDRT